MRTAVDYYMYCYCHFFRWDTLSWPRKILDQIDITENQMEQDEQKFHKKLIDDQTQLEDKLDTLQVSKKYMFSLTFHKSRDVWAMEEQVSDV